MGNCGGIEMETRAFSGRYAATSKSSIAWTNAARSMGARGGDLAVGDRGFIDEGRTGIFQIRLDAPPAGGALAASQAGIRKDPWAVADRGDDLTSRPPPPERNRSPWHRHAAYRGSRRRPE